MKRSVCAVLVLSAFSTACSEHQQVKLCPADSQERYSYVESKTGSQLSVERNGSILTLNFSGPSADYDPGMSTLKIHEDGDFYRVAGLSIPKDLATATGTNSHPSCDFSGVVNNPDQYRISCHSDDADEIAVFDVVKGIIEWGTSSQSDGTISNYMLRSETGLLHRC